MSDVIWKTVGVVDNENMMVPHVLQQKCIYVHARDEYEISPEHRLVPISDLDGVDE